MTKLLNIRQVAKYLCLTPDTIYRKVRKGEIPAIKIGRIYRFDKKELLSWLKQNSTNKK